MKKKPVSNLAARNYVMFFSCLPTFLSGVAFRHLCVISAGLRKRHQQKGQSSKNQTMKTRFLCDGDESVNFVAMEHDLALLIKHGIKMESLSKRVQENASRARGDLNDHCSFTLETDMGRLQVEFDILGYDFNLGNNRVATDLTKNPQDLPITCSLQMSVNER